MSWFDDLVSLRVFVLLAEEIEAKGGASRVEIEQSLEAKKMEGLVSDDLSVSRPSLKRRTGIVESKLEDRWGRTVRLLEVRKKKYYLTVDGRKFLRKAKSYLSSLSRQ